MKHFITSIANGGAPIYVDDLIAVDNENKKAYEAILAGLGDKIIISGVEVSNLNTIANTFDLSAGFVFLNGEVMEIPAYSGSYPIFIHEATPVDVDRDFEDGNTDPVLNIRTAEYTGTPSGDNIELNYTSGYYLETIIKRKSHAIGDIRLVTDLTGKFDGTGLGTDTSVERGFALCNGQNGTPDLSGTFITGYSETPGDYDTIGNTGGEEEHTLTLGEIPTHNHNFLPDSDGSSGDGTTATRGAATNDGSGGTGTAGNDEPHENRPPYYVAAYVMRVS